MSEEPDSLSTHGDVRLQFSQLARPFAANVATREQISRSLAQEGQFDRFDKKLGVLERAGKETAMQRQSSAKAAA